MKTRGRRKTLGLELLTLLISLLVIASSMIRPVNATIEYNIDSESVYLEINKDGTIKLFYDLNISITGDPQKGITLRLPNVNATDIAAIDGNGNNLTTKLEKDPYPMIEILWSKEEEKGITNTTITVKALTFVNANMFYNDTKTNPGNVAMKFTPAWFDDVNTNTTLKFEILLPEKVNETRLKYSPNVDVIVKDINDKTEVQWTKYQWPSKNNFEVTVSFPANLVDFSIPLPPETPQPIDWITWILYTAAAVGIIAMIVKLSSRGFRWIRRRRRRRTSTRDRISDSASTTTIERPPRVLKGMKTAEAATLMDDFDVNKVISIIIYGLYRKGSIAVEERVPELKVRKISNSGLEDYELEVYNAIQNDKCFNKQRLRVTYDNLKRKVQRKMVGYNISATVRSYRDEVEEAWDWTDADKIYVEVTSTN